ncbi:citrate synthase [Paraburkholderia dipogonis]|uniref:citrate synthase n=1 Tax=Paraburkholderia dipogonis TaxID=1211383 RepID=UPI0038BD8A77
MKKQNDFLTREEALAALGVKVATLYSYVSRGLIRSVPVAGSKRHLYASEDVERFAARGRGRLPRSVTAGTSMRWGEPVVASSITYIDERGPVYRNRRALDLAQGGHAFEVVVHFLITGVWQDTQADWPPADISPDTAALLAAHAKAVAPDDIGNLMAMVALSLGMRGRDRAEMADGATVQMARTILHAFTGCLGFLSKNGRYIVRKPGESLAAWALRASGAPVTPQAVQAVNSTLVILADHELTPATFAARVAASIDAGLCNCVAAAISAHVGYSTGAVTDRVETQLFDDPRGGVSNSRLELVRTRGASLYGFNHPLYPAGDPRAEWILSLASRCGDNDPAVRKTLKVLERLRDEDGMTPGLALALVPLTRALGMPGGSATALWILGRTAGWCAHVVEQRMQAFMLRPRAKYISAAPNSG